MYWGEPLSRFTPITLPVILKINESRMNLNYTYLHTGSDNRTVNYYIAHLLYEVVSDTETELLDFALRATSWEWDRWFYVPDTLLVTLNEAELEKIRAGITSGLLKVVDNYEDLLLYFRWLGQDRIYMDYLNFVPKGSGIMVFYPQVGRE